MNRRPDLERARGAHERGPDALRWDRGLFPEEEYLHVSFRPGRRPHRIRRPPKPPQESSGNHTGVVYDQKVPFMKPRREVVEGQMTDGS